MPRSSCSGAPPSARDEQGRPPGVGGGVGVGHGGRQQPAGHLGRQPVGRHEGDGPDPRVHRRLVGPHVLVVLAADDEPAEERRRDVVGVPLELVGQGEAVVQPQPVRPALDERPRQGDAADDRRRRRSEPARVGDAVRAREEERRRRDLHRAERRVHRPDDQVGGIQRYDARALARHLDHEGVATDLGGQLVAQLEREAEAVVAGAEVGAGGRDGDPDRPGTNVTEALPRRPPARPRDR